MWEVVLCDRRWGWRCVVQLLLVELELRWCGQRRVWLQRLSVVWYVLWLLRWLRWWDVWKLWEE